SRVSAPMPRTALYAAIDSHLNPPMVARPSAGARGRGRGALAMGAALSLALLPLDAALAATITVDTNATDVVADGACSLPEAVANANDNAQTHVDCAAGEGGLDTIVFTPDLADTEVTLSEAL